MDLVAAAFEKIEKEKEKYKPITVTKLIDLDYYPGNLLAIDTNELDKNQLKSNTEKYLLNLARDNTQLLLNKIWELPAEKQEEAVVVKLPKQNNYVLPREKHIPKPRPLTKWEAFAKEKGLQKKKKVKVTWDDILKKWVPVHGFKKAVSEKDKNWLIEVPQNADPYEDQFEKKATAKKERVAKNEFSRLRNIAASHNIKVPNMGILTSDKLSSTELKTAEGVAKLSTASLGKFQPRLRKEKENVKQKNIPGVQKRKIMVVPAAVEKASNLEILDGILNKKPKLDVDKAVNKQIFVEQQQRAQEKKNEKPKGKGKRKGHAKGGGAGGGAGAKGGGSKGKKSAMIASKIGKVKGKRKHGGSAGGKKVGKRYSGGGKRR
ncbi:hypothetical protein LSTR_LSTR006286 [Laodelphax striatellus]|uniref:Ribosome biogenesis regulatory protein n=1 Tax=Laodelphax striatellus TaxID=195883 RepID=A0A482X5H3_LAOST|nr:hypothetical protein LSTR_LSTR006286 [Laodelphax striatellus]